MGARASTATAVVIAAGLACTGTGCMKRYLNASKMAEARANLHSISLAAANAYETEKMSAAILGEGSTTTETHSLCKSATKKVPSSASEIMGKKYMSSPSDWKSDPPDTGFTCLKYSNDMPQYYMYNYTMTGKGSAEGDSYSATAEGDLNGDGVLSKFEITGKVSGGTVVASQTIAETNPNE